MEPRKLLQRDGTKEGYGQRELKGSHQPNHSEVTDVVIWFPNQVFEKIGKGGAKFRKEDRPFAFLR